MSSVRVKHTNATKLGAWWEAASHPLIAMRSEKRLLRLTRFEHVTALTNSVTDLDAHFAQSEAAGGTPNSLLREAVRKVVEDDRFEAPGAAEYTLPVIVQFIMLVCKRMAFKVLEMHHGIPDADGQRSFTTSVESAFDAHVTALAQRIVREVPYDDKAETADHDGNDDTSRKPLAVHLQMARQTIRAYCRETSEEIRNIANTTTTASMMALPLSKLDSQAIFVDPKTAPRTEDVIFHCLQPWLRTLFVASFVSMRPAAQFKDIWYSSGIVHVIGYKIFDECYARMPEANQTLANAREEVAAAQRSCTLALYAFWDASARLKPFVEDSYSALATNTAGSAALKRRAEQADLRRKSIEAVATTYVQTQRRARIMRYVLWSVIVGYVIATVAVASLVLLRATDLAFLITGIIMLAILVYGFVITFRQS